MIESAPRAKVDVQWIVIKFRRRFVMNERGLLFFTQSHSSKKGPNMLTAEEQLRTLLHHGCSFWTVGGGGLAFKERRGGWPK